ncbi:hypothetical protein L1049_019429 [Liquidambar formosana]|uniref:Uncharacterized protein n=1 Tax=Liquidambar formosana TaxID=63359 RepID=A0AAP0SBQ7_LIQFO
MGKMGFLAVRADEATSDLITFDLQELHTASIKLANHAIKLASLGFGTTFCRMGCFLRCNVSSLSLSLPLSTKHVI